MHMEIARNSVFDCHLSPISGPGAKYNDFFFYITPIFYFHLSFDESNGVFYGLHSIDSDEVAQVSLLI